MTKHRPSWSEWLRWAATLVCGLLMLNVPTLWAAQGKASAKKSAVSPVHRASAKAVAHKAGKKPAKSVTRGSRAVGRNQLKHRAADAPEPEVLSAQFNDEEQTGLRGQASFYAYGFQGRRTATGEVFRVEEFTAASNHFPLGTMVAVQRLDNDLCAIVKVNDRMHAKHRKRIIDVSRGVAEYLDMIRAGVVLVRVARLKADWREKGLTACQTAFEAPIPCPDCAPPPQKLPEISNETEN